MMHSAIQKTMNECQQEPYTTHDQVPFSSFSIIPNEALAKPESLLGKRTMPNVRFEFNQFFYSFAVKIHLNSS